MTTRTREGAERCARTPLLAIKTPSKRAARARLFLDMDELARSGWATLDTYACVRGIKTAVAARRSLYRLKKTLENEGVLLELSETNGVLQANFATRRIAEYLERDLGDARALVERLDATREERQPDLDGEDPEDDHHENDLVDPELLSYEYRDRMKSFGWIAHKHAIGVKRVRRILASSGPILPANVRRCVEERRPRDVVARAADAVNRRARLTEIAEILGCSLRTARRFVKRQGEYLPPGRPRRT